MKCNCDDCELVHCTLCGSHTVGNVLVCQGCLEIEEDEYNRMMLEKWEDRLRDESVIE